MVQIRFPPLLIKLVLNRAERDGLQTVPFTKCLKEVAGIEIDHGIDSYTYRRGLFVMKQSGETVKIINDVQFQPVGFA